MQAQHYPASGASSRILDVPCKVCGDYSSGKHYNIFACDGCAGFFKRSIRRNRRYICKGKEGVSCKIDKAHRNQCRACRLQKCQDVGMNKDAVQHERGPRNSTIRRAMTSFLEQQQQRIHSFNPSPPAAPILASPACNGVLNLALPKVSFARAPPMEPPILSGFPLRHPNPFGYMLPMFPALPFPTPHLKMSPPASPPLSGNTPEAICESAARLLFLNAQWAKSQPYFTALQMCDQLVLLEDSWKELFVLGLVQFMPTINLTSLMERCDVMQSDSAKQFVEEVKRFNDVLLQIKNIQLDPNEFVYIRVMLLFRGSCSGMVFPDNGRELAEEDSINLIASDAKTALNKYITNAKPFESQRFSRIFMALGRIQEITADLIAELFFKKAVGKIPIANTIRHMYRSMLTPVQCQ